MRRSRVEGRMCNAVQGRVPREAVRILGCARSSLARSAASAPACPSTDDEGQGRRR